jgi:hypothetical protein
MRFKIVEFNDPGLLLYEMSEDFALRMMKKLGWKEYPPYDALILT